MTPKYGVTVELLNVVMTYLRRQNGGHDVTCKRLNVWIGRLGQVEHEYRELARAQAKAPRGPDHGAAYRPGPGEKPPTEGNQPNIAPVAEIIPPPPPKQQRERARAKGAAMNCVDCGVPLTPVNRSRHQPDLRCLRCFSEFAAGVEEVLLGGAESARKAAKSARSGS